MATNYVIEAVVDGMWHYFAGRLDDGSRLSGATGWVSTNDKAVRFQSKREAERERRRLGGVTFLREVGK